MKCFLPYAIQYSITKSGKFAFTQRNLFSLVQSLSPVNKQSQNMTANSRNEEYVTRVNRLYDIYLARELLHFEKEKKVYLKIFRREFQLVKDRRDRILDKVKEIKRSRVSETELQSRHDQKKNDFFLTE